MPPRLTFYCELDAAGLDDLFADPAVIDGLRALDARVSLGIIDLSDTRARIVKRLTSSGIPVAAWLLLPEDDGYWFSATNYAAAAARWSDVVAWTKEHGLAWDAIGFDAEFDIRDVKRLAEDRRSLAYFLWKRLRSRPQVIAAQYEYRMLYADIVVAGYEVEHYLLPFMLDEARMRSKLIQQLTGIVDVPGDRHVPMLYTSFVRKAGGPGVIWSYGREVSAIAVGSTGGGVTVAGADEIPPLDWDEFARDLRLANRLCDDVFVFSLEGCARQGFLWRLADFGWEAPVPIPYAETLRVERFRRRLRTLLWVDAHPKAVITGLLAIGTLVCAIKRRRQAADSV